MAKNNHYYIYTQTSSDADFANGIRVLRRESDVWETVKPPDRDHPFYMRRFLRNFDKADYLERAFWATRAEFADIKCSGYEVTKSCVDRIMPVEDDSDLEDYCHGVDMVRKTASEPKVPHDVVPIEERASIDESLIREVVTPLLVIRHGSMVSLPRTPTTVDDT